MLPWIAIDIETGNGRPEEIERQLRRDYFPPSNYKKAEAIGNALLELAERRKEKSAVADGAPIYVVSLALPFSSSVIGEIRVLHCLREEPLTERDDMTGKPAFVEGFATRRQMLEALRVGLELASGPETVLVGHNIRAFDLVRLRWSYLRAGLRMPSPLAFDGQPIFDTMREFGRRFSAVERPFVALSDLLEEFGMPNHKSEVSGAMVPGMIEAGEVDRLVAYAATDARTEAELFLRMTGQTNDEPEAACA